MSQTNKGDQPTVFITMFQDPDGVNEWMWINATHQGRLQEIAKWLGERSKEMLEALRRAEAGVTAFCAILANPHNDFIKQEVETIQRHIDSFLKVQTLLAQEKLDDALVAYNDIQDYYYIDTGEEPVGP
jgi:hypothetical protein